MSETRFQEITASPPREGLPAPYVFAPRSEGREGRPNVQGALEWLEEHLGPGVDIGLDDDRRLGPDEPWGYWPGGAVLFQDSSHAVWFKLVWC